MLSAIRLLYRKTSCRSREHRIWILGSNWRRPRGMLMKMEIMRWMKQMVWKTKSRMSAWLRGGKLPKLLRRGGLSLKSGSERRISGVCKKRRNRACARRRTLGCGRKKIYVYEKSTNGISKKKKSVLVKNKTKSSRREHHDVVHALLQPLLKRKLPKRHRKLLWKTIKKELLRLRLPRNLLPEPAKASHRHRHPHIRRKI